jgi:Uncharacterized protein conserved in bacteria
MKYFIFLKGVNVGGKSKVGMVELKTELQKIIPGDIGTFLNSGNLIIDSDLEEKNIDRIVKETIRNLSKLEVFIHIKSKIELEEVLKHNPFTNYDKSKVIVYFLSTEIDSKLLAVLKSNKKIIEESFAYRKYLYVYYSDGVGKSVLTTNLIDKQLVTNSTGRNINTIERILEK